MSIPMARPHLLVPCLALLLCCGGTLEQTPQRPITAVAETAPAVAEEAQAVQREAQELRPAAAETRFEAPTWSEVFDRYLALGTQGGCARSAGCHASEMKDATSAYAWLSQRGYISGTDSALVSPRNSCLRWFGGNMPPKGHDDADAAQALSAWVAAGALP
jgi:hypothetical protein